MALSVTGLRGYRLQIRKDLLVPGRDGKCTSHPGDTLFVQDPCGKACACLGALLFVLLLCMTCMFDVRESTDVLPRACGGQRAAS